MSSSFTVDPSISLSPKKSSTPSVLQRSSKFVATFEVRPEFVAASIVLYRPGNLSSNSEFARQSKPIFHRRNGKSLSKSRFRREIKPRFPCKSLYKSGLWANRIKIIEARAVFELVETEVDQNLESKKITELIFTLLAHLCSCADGRAQFLKHTAGIAMVSKRLLRVSNATDDEGLHIFDSISRFSATNEVLVEIVESFQC